MREERGFEHRLNKLQRRVQATAISADTRDRHETLRLLLQPPRSLAQVTIHTSPPRSLCSLPLPGSPHPGTTSLGEHRACLRLVQRHASLCCRRLAPHSVPLPPRSLSESEPPNQLLLFFFFNSFYLFIYLFIYGCVGSSFLCEGFL